MKINTNVNSITSVRKFGIGDKIGYLLGEFGNDFMFMMPTAFLMLYYTDILRISPAAIGVVLIVAKAWDAFADVSVGRFIDLQPNTKNGKFRPWLIRFAPFLVIAFILMFTRIPNLSNNATVIYGFAIYLIWGTLYSAVNIPYGSMASVITSDPVERASLSNFRSMGSAIAIAGIMAIVPALIFVNNKPDADRFFWAAIVLGILAILSYLACYKLTIERVIQVENYNKKQQLKLSTTLKEMVKNRPFVGLICASIVVLLAQMITTALNSYLFKDYFHNTTAMSISGMITLLNIVIVAPAIAPLSKKFGKKEMASGGLLVSSILNFLIFLMPIQNAFLFVVLNYIASLGYNLFYFTIWAFVTDCIDYQEYRTESREDGTIYSIYSFTRKVAQAVAGGLGAFVLEIIGYSVKAPEQTAEVASKIRTVSLLTPAISYFIVFLIMTFVYTMNKEALTEIHDELERRRTREN
jgi:GPH family glycoside/pentoside/hexuronide:cation symporter